RLRLGVGRPRPTGVVAAARRNGQENQDSNPLHGASPFHCVQVTVSGPIHFGETTLVQLQLLLSHLFSCDSGVPQLCRSVGQSIDPLPFRFRLTLSLLVASSPKVSWRYTMSSPLSSTTSRMRELPGHSSLPDQTAPGVPQVYL